MAAPLSLSPGKTQLLSLPPGLSFAPLLSQSCNGFAVVDLDGRYAWVSDSTVALLNVEKATLIGRPVAELVYAEDRPALAVLLAQARHAAAADLRSETYVVIRHLATGANWFTPVEVKAVCDGKYVYLVILDARMPARLENLLPDFLFSTSHDLRTPACSIQTATSLLMALPEVAADAEAMGLLLSMDAACSVLLRCVSNVLQMRQLQRDGRLPAAAPCAFDPKECVRRVVDMVTAFEGVATCVDWDEWPVPPLPPVVLSDERALEACLQNLLMQAVRFGAWAPQEGSGSKPLVRVRVATERMRREAAVQLHVTAVKNAEAGDTAESADADPYAFTLLVCAETPGRPLTDAEVAAALSPFGMLPASKGGGTGMALFVAIGLARALGGNLTVGRADDATVLTARIPLRATDSANVPLKAAAEQTGVEAIMAEAAAEPETTSLPVAGAPSSATSALELDGLTARMFECLLTNSDDVFVICRVRTAEGDMLDNEGEAELQVLVEYISPSVAWRLAYNPHDVVGRNLIDVCHPDDRGQFAAMVRDAYRGDGPRGHQLLLLHRSLPAVGEHIWCHTAGVCDGDCLYLVCRDVRQRKSVELALRAFTLATSHDLREPCNAILVSSEVLERRACVSSLVPSPPPSPTAAVAQATTAAAALDARFLVRCIRAACGLLLGIVGNVLTVPQVEAGELTLQHDIFNPAAVLGDVLHACRLGCPDADASAGGGIEWETAPGDAPLPPLVEGDCSRIAQCVQNCITNGVEFGRGHTVHVHVTLEPPQHPDADSRPCLCVRVRDEGPGMSPERVATCFTAKTAAPASAGGGYGLGLFISNAFARLMSGSLSVQSTLGEGATFTLLVPVRLVDEDEAEAVAAVHEAAARADVEEEEAAAAHAAASAGFAAAAKSEPSATKRRQPQSLRQHYRCLLADDHPLNLRLVTRLLQLHNFDVTSVADGGSALAVLQASYAPGGSPFDVAMLDMNMPILSGPETAQKFRAWEATARPGAMRLPIIALTANVMEEHAIECSAAGMDIFLAKPLRSEAIPALRAAAAAHAEQRALEVESRLLSTDARTALAAAAEAAAAGATAAQALLMSLPRPSSLRSLLLLGSSTPRGMDTAHGAGRNQQ